MRSIITNSGAKIFWPNVGRSAFRIEDIALSLSRQPRWGGQTKGYYSVAHHSVNCALVASGTEHELPALLHDAAEAYLCDIPTPFKVFLQSYSAMEERFLREIGAQLNVKLPASGVVKEIDARMMKTESMALMSDAWMKAAFADGGRFMHDVEEYAPGVLARTRHLDQDQIYRMFIEIYNGGI